MRMLLALGLGLGLTAACLSPAEAQEEPRAVIARAIQAHGGAAKLQTIKATQTKTKGTLLLMQGIPFTEEIKVQLPGKLRESTQFTAGGRTVSVTIVYDGTNAWIQANDQTSNAPEAIKNALKEALYVMSVGRFTTLESKDFTLAPLGEIKIDDRPAVGVKVSHQDRKDVNLYFDKESGLLTKLEYRTLDLQTGQQVTEERLIKEYQDIDGMKAAKRIVVYRDGRKHLEAEVVEARYPDHFNANEFAKP